MEDRVEQYNKMWHVRDLREGLGTRRKGRGICKGVDEYWSNYGETD